MQINTYTTWINKEIDIIKKDDSSSLLKSSSCCIKQLFAFI